MVKFLFAFDVGYMTNLCVYGYSFTVLIPILFICLIPYDIVKYISLGYGLVTSIIFLIVNIYQVLSKESSKAKYVILCMIVVFQLLLYFTLKFYFFASLYEGSKKNIQTDPVRI